MAPDPRWFVPTLLLCIAVSVWMVWHIYQYNKLRRSEYQIITSRFPKLALIHGIILTPSFVFLPLARVFGGPEGQITCGWENTIELALNSLGASFYFSRCYLLVLTYRIQREFSLHGPLYSDSYISDGSEVSVTVSDSRPKHQRDSWLMNHQFVFRAPFITVLVFILSFCFWIGPLISSLTCTPQIATKTQPLLVVPFFVAVVLTILVFKTNEVMGIGTELKVYVFSIVLRLVLKLLCPYLGIVGPFGVYELIDRIAAIGFFWAIVCYPQILVKKRKEKLKNMKESVVMAEFLSDRKLGFRFFRQYLELEFCVENLLFWNDAQHFTQNPSVRKALHLYRTYIMRTAALQVNLPHPVRKYIVECVANYSKIDRRQHLRYLELQKIEKRSTTAPQTVPLTPQPIINNNIVGEDSITASARYRNSDATNSVDIQMKSTIDQNIVVAFDNGRKVAEDLLANGPWLRFIESEEFVKWEDAHSNLEIVNSTAV